MSNRCWQRRRTKRGLAARQYAAIVRQIRRAKRDGKPLPLTFRSRGTGLIVTVTLHEPGGPLW